MNVFCLRFHVCFYNNWYKAQWHSCTAVRFYLSVVFFAVFFPLSLSLTLCSNLSNIIIKRVKINVYILNLYLHYRLFFNTSSINSSYIQRMSVLYTIFFLFLNFKLCLSYRLIYRRMETIILSAQINCVFMSGIIVAIISRTQNVTNYLHAYVSFVY